MNNYSSNSQLGNVTFDQNFQPRYDGSMGEMNDANMWELVGIGPFTNLNNK